MSNAEYSLPNGYMLLWYRIESILGQGGFGITYLAHDTNLNHKVAIKEFFPSEIANRASDHSTLHSSPDVYDWGLSHFISEAQTLAKCRHPNIVSINSVFEANNTAYIVMEYIHGQSLKSAITNHWRPGEAELKKFMFAVMDGLSQIHLRGFIHRDIKPDNIILRENLNPVLVDFGSARQSSNEMTSLISSGYTPFEQYNQSGEDNKQGPWTDIYSLAATTYSVITGKCPVDSVSRLGSLLKGAADPLVPISKLAARDYTTPFLRAIDSALAVQPTDRPQNIEEWKALFSESSKNQFGYQAGNSLDTRVLKKTRKDEVKIKPAEDARTVVITDTTGPDANQQIPGKKRTKPIFPVTSTKWLSLLIVCLVIGVLAIAGTYISWNSQEDDAISFGTISNDPLANIQANNNDEEAIRKLLMAAEQDFNDASFYLAEGRRVQQRLNEVLAHAPDHSAASEGLVMLFNRYIQIAHEAVTAKTFDQAEHILKEAESIFPGSTEVSQVRDRLDLTKSQNNAMPEAVSSIYDTITTLLANAEQDIRAQRLVTPPKNNALYRYKQVLDMDPGNQQAYSGIKQLIDRYVRFADRAIAEQQFGMARTYLKQAETGLPTMDRLLQQAHRRVNDAESRLTIDVKRSGKKKIEILLASAERDIKALRLSSPPGNNAWEKYLQVLKLRPNHPSAIRGGQRVIQTFKNIIEDALNNSRITEATQYLKDAEDVLPMAYQRSARERLQQLQAKPMTQLRPPDSAEIQRLLHSALKVISTSRLVSPTGQNAQDRYT